MKLLKNIIPPLLLIISFALLVQCEKKDSFSDINSEKFALEVASDDDFYINIDKAEVVANQTFLTEPLNTNFKQGIVKKLKNKTSFKDKKGLDALYVFNYETNGEKSFVIISGDKRLSPVLAYSNKNNFNFDTILPNGIAYWLISKIEKISDLRAKIIDIDPRSNVEWKKYNLEGELSVEWERSNSPGDVEEPGEGGDPDDCLNYDYVYQAGPLLQTAWGQGCVYNELSPLEYSESDLNCDTLPCDRGYTGCIATAMAQIMRYHEYPTSYNWSLMRNNYHYYMHNYPGANDVAQLMKDVGDAVNMDYECKGSGAGSGDVDNALENTFGYTEGGELGSFLDKYEIVKSNLCNGKPVILTGCRDVGFLGLYYTNCHAWVCDGYQIFQNSCVTLLFFNMNWGWNGAYDGWYGIFDFAPKTERNYQYDQEAIVNIQP